MKKYLWLISMIAVLGCDHSIMDPFSRKSFQKTQPPELNEQFVLPIEKTVTFESEGLSIRFDSVPLDCRCPDGALCIWMGEAVVSLTVENLFSESAIPLTLNLSTYPGKQEVQFFSYTIELLGVTPYPIVDQQIDTTTYQATLILKKAVGQ